MKTSYFQVKNKDGVHAKGEVNHEDGKALDAIAINIAANIALAMNMVPEATVMIWRQNAKGTAGGHKKPERRSKVKEGENVYKAVAA